MLLTECWRLHFLDFYRGGRRGFVRTRRSSDANDSE
jgi:hypothetical protein